MNIMAGHNQNAYYDPHSKCIKYDPSLLRDGDGGRGGVGGTATLSGVVVDGGDILKPGKMLMGEIIEIIDPDETKEDAVDRDHYEEYSHGSAGGLLTRSFIETVRRDAASAIEEASSLSTTVAARNHKEDLLQKQRQLQTLHAQQNQRLIRKHTKDRQWFHSQQLNEERLVELETLHQKEVMEMQTRHQREQNDIVELICSCTMILVEESIKSTEHLKEQSRQQADLIKERSRQELEEREEQSRKTAERLREQSKQQMDQLKEQIRQQELQIKELNERPLPQSPAAADPPSAAPAAPIPTEVAHPTTTAAAASLPDKITLDRQKADEIKAVMRNRSLSREERQQKLAEIKERYNAMANGNSANAAAAPAPSSSGASARSDKSIGEQRRLELQSVMKDKSLGREEKQERLAEIKAKYAAMSDDKQGSRRASQDDKTDKKKERASKSRQKEDTKKSSRREKDTVDPSESEESASEEDAPPRGEASSSRWKRAGAKVKAGNAMKTSSSTNKKGRDPDPHSNYANSDDDEEEEEEEEEAAATTEDESDRVSSRERATSRWNKAAVKVAATHMVSENANHHPNNDDSVRSSGVSSMDLVFDAPPGASATKGNESKNSSQSTIPEDPLEDIPTDRTPVKKLVKKLNEDDPSLTVLKLDGRKKIKKEDWESLFESLEENSTLTHISMSRCEITDELAVSLVLALVENETLQAIRLNSNKGLTDDTAKGFIKVLLQSNKTLKKLEMTRTKVTKKSTQKLNEILEERDGEKQTSKMQEERQKKIKALLSFSAGDQVAKDTQEAAVPKEETLRESFQSKKSAKEDESVRSASASRASSRRKGTRRGLDKSEKSSKRSSSRSSNRSSARTPSVGASRRAPARRAGRGGARGGRGTGSSVQASMRASVTAAQMAQLGGNIANVGADQQKLKETRKLRGECEICGQKCFTKTMFKTTPLTIPNAVLNGRCLKCNPM